jgi:4-hydroxy-3-polyprenylbenzoate decarboxylase
MPRYLVCLTGASGALYGLRLLELLARGKDLGGAGGGAEVHLVVSAWGERVVEEETGLSIDGHLARLTAATRASITRHDAADLAAPPASGSFRFDAAAIVPASMGTVGALASGNVRNLVHRAGAVALKEGWPLVVAPRETPLSLVDLRNLATLAEAGASILPLCPAFYNRPSTVDELVDGVVSRLLDRMGAHNPLAKPWTGAMKPQGEA